MSFENQIYFQLKKEKIMGVTAIVGGNWGDEGKGKMTDLLAKEADLYQH